MERPNCLKKIKKQESYVDLLKLKQGEVVFPGKESLFRLLSGETTNSIAEHAKESYLLHLGKTKSDLAKLVEEKKIKSPSIGSLLSKIDSKEKQTVKIEEEKKSTEKPKNERLLPYWLRYASVVIFVLVAIYSSIKPMLDKNEPIEKNRWEVNVIPKGHNPNAVFSNDSTSFKLLVLPFEDNESDELSKLEKKFLRFFEEKKLEDSLNIEVKYINNRSITPFHTNQAEKLVNEYNASMAIWGIFIENKEYKDDKVRIKYSFSNEVLGKLNGIKFKIKNKAVKNSYNIITSIEGISENTFQNDIEKIIYWILMVNYTSSGKQKNALELYEKINLSNDESTSFLFDMALQLIALKSYNEALDIYARLHKMDIDNQTRAIIWYNTTQILGSKKEFDKALMAIDSALFYAPNSPYVFLKKGWILEEQKQDYKGAIKMFDKVLLIDSTNVDA